MTAGGEKPRRDAPMHSPGAPGKGNQEEGRGGSDPSCRCRPPLPVSCSSQISNLHQEQSPSLSPTRSGDFRGAQATCATRGIDGNQASASVMEETAKITACACKTTPRSSRRSSRDHNPAASSPGPRDLHPGRVLQPGQRSHPHRFHRAGCCQRSSPPAFPRTEKAGTLQGNAFSA